MATLKGLSLIRRPHLSAPLNPLGISNSSTVGMLNIFIKDSIENLICTPKITNMVTFLPFQKTCYPCCQVSWMIFTSYVHILFTKAKRWEKMQKHEKQSQQVEQKITYN